MAEIFLKFVNTAISAGWLVLVVILIRTLFPKIPKWLRPVFWGLVGLRLMLIFSIKSVFSLIPSAQTIAPEIMFMPEPTIYSGISFINHLTNPLLSKTFAPNPGDSANPLQILIPVMAALWLSGVILMLVFALVSCLRLRSRMRTAVLLRENIYQSEKVTSPFVFGFLHPRIYLPFSMDEKTIHNILLHEQAHIDRRDHLGKILGYLLLSLYWFQPLCWVAYLLFCRDIELACDERVIRDFEREERADYSQALLAFCAPGYKRYICPLAFGEIAVKERVKNVLHYKKPASWAVTAALAACIVIAVCFLTNPKHINFREAGLKEIYVLRTEEAVGVLGAGTLSFYDDRSYQLIFSPLSSYIAVGKYEIEGKKLKLNNLFDDNKYVFDIVDGTLVFDGEASSDTIWWQGGEVLE